MPDKTRSVSPAGYRLLTEVLAAAWEGAILAGQAEPHRECSMAVSGDRVVP
jgi:hypothetical protein